MADFAVPASLRLILNRDMKAAGGVKVNTDAGNDTMTVENVSAALDVSLVGGSDVDTLINLGVSAGNILEIKEFEILP